MRAKKLGRHELLSWINNLTQSDYTKIENLSDGVAFCQVFDAFYENLDLNKLKCKILLIWVNSKNVEDWEKNLSILNEILTKIKSFKQIDPLKLSKGKFSVNFEFLQFVYDFIMKNQKGEPSKVKYNAYERRLEILKSQYGNKISDIKKYLPTHLIPNEMILKIDKQKYFGGESTVVEKVVENNKVEEEPNNSNVNSILDKYKDFFSILKDDLKKIVDRSNTLSNEISDTEEERQYYLDKIKNVLTYCEKKLKNQKIKQESVNMLNSIIKIITYVPEDFKKK